MFFTKDATPNHDMSWQKVSSFMLMIYQTVWYELKTSATPRTVGDPRSGPCNKKKKKKKLGSRGSILLNSGDGPFWDPNELVGSGTG